MNNSELKRRLKAEQKAKEKEAKQSQKVLYVFEITLHSRTWLNVCLIFSMEVFDFSGAEHSSLREQKEGRIRRRIFGSECKRTFF